MSAIGTKRTSAGALHMSAFDPKRTCSDVFGLFWQRTYVLKAATFGSNFIKSLAVPFEAVND